MKKLMLFIFLSTISSTAQNAPTTQLDNISSALDSLVIKYKLPGLSIGIVSKDSIIGVYNYGYSNMENKIEVNENTKFRVGSITKSFLALGFLKLVEQGDIDIDAKVSSLAPEILIENKWEEKNPLRLVHLLEHTAGLDDIHFNDLSIEDISRIPLKKAISKQKNSMKVRWKPGSRYSYSSVGYTIAGYILEKVSGEKYEDFLQKVILGPLNMNESTFYIPTKADNMLAVGYEGLKELPQVYMNSRPAGSMISTVMDFSLFLRFMLNNGTLNGEQIFAEASIERMGTSKSSRVAKKGLKIGYGLALPSYYKNGFLWYGHSGGGPGCLAKYAYCKELDVGYIFMMNTFDLEAEKEIRDVIVDFLTENQKMIVSTSIKVENNVLNQYKGYYEPRNPRLELYAWLSILFDGIHIKVENDTLVSKSFLEKKTPLLHVRENLFRESKEPDASAIFITTEDDNIIFQKGNKHYIKTAIWKPWLYRTSFILSILFMISIVIVGLIWIPLYLVRKYILKKRVSKNIQLIIFPVLAISSIFLGISLIVDQTMVELTQMTNANIAFCISTYLFAGFSVAGVFIVMRDFKGSFRRPIKIYTILVSLSFLGFTIFLTYWEFIGIRLWGF
jgi:CubicO group peptidase (beta-lactamase class C family)